MTRKFFFIGVLLALLAVALPVAAQTPVAPAATQTVYGTVQEFEHGLMIWRSDTAHIWALIDDGTAFSFPASSYSTLPDNPIFGNPPSRLRPIFGFGKVWGNVSNVRDLLGWPVRQEIGYNMPVSTGGGVTSITQLNGTVINISGGSWYRSSAMPTPPPPPGASILSLNVTPQAAPRGSEVVVSWTMQGVDVALVEVYDMADNTFITSQTGLPLQGSTSVTVPNLIQGNMRVVVYGARILDTSPMPEYQKLVQRSGVVQVQAAPPQALSSYAAYQRYEHGFMVWRADNEAVYVFFEDSGTTGRGSFSIYPIDAYRGWQDNPVGGDAPAGFVRPINAFGRVWGNNAIVRTRLGWATAGEQGYTAQVEQTGTQVNVLTLPDGLNLRLTRFGSWSAYR